MTKLLTKNQRRVLQYVADNGGTVKWWSIGVGGQVLRGLVQRGFLRRYTPDRQIVVHTDLTDDGRKALAGKK